MGLNPNGVTKRRNRTPDGVIDCNKGCMVVYCSSFFCSTALAQKSNNSS
nr:MAG TPA: hypothetical protein [Caudoviricetes sp.]